MRRRDPRVNASVLTFREYLITFLFCNTLCAVVVQIYAAIRRSGTPQSETVQEALPLLLGFGGFIVFASLIISLLSVYWRIAFLSGKVGILSEAAQKVAAGDYSVRIPPQRKDGKKEDYDLSEQLAETVLGFDRKLTENEIDLEADWDDEIGIFSDPGLLQIVWNNLLSNAVKFTPRGGNIRIAAQRDGSGARVSFSDSGCGIAEQDISRIFEKFYQADTSRKTKGNGLGLAMVKEILDLLGCRIEIQSRIGQGSVFTVWIP